MSVDNDGTNHHQEVKTGKEAAMLSPQTTMGGGVAGTLFPPLTLPGNSILDPRGMSPFKPAASIKHHTLDRNLQSLPKGPSNTIL